MHVYRWDLDKTYLHTDFGSVRALVRTALEPAAAKRNTAGSGELLRALQAHDPSSRTTVVSGSPKQMRRTLTAKLAMDGIRVDKLTLKDNLGNLRRGRLRAVWGQVGYKLPHLLAERAEHAPGDTETLFGDDAEVDAAVYAVYADAISGRIDGPRVRQVLERGGAYGDDIDRAMRALSQAPRSDAVEDIFIRLDAGGPVGRFDVLGPRVIPVFSWVQAALVLHGRGRIGVEGVETVFERCAESETMTPVAVAGLIQDSIRRGLVAPEPVLTLVDSSATLTQLCGPLAALLSRLGPVRARPRAHAVPDAIAFLEAHA